MADILLRLNKEMLVLSSAADAAFERAGVAQRDIEMTLLLEPEVAEEIYKLEEFAEPQCWVAPTAGLTPARLRAVGMDGRAEELARAALQVAGAVRPQHVLAEIGPCGLPLDGSSKASLNENCDQYKCVAQLLEGMRGGADAQAGTVDAAGVAAFDAYLLNGFERTADLKCALMGLRKVTDAPVFVSVDVRPDGMLAGGFETLEQAAEVAADLGAQVFGFAVAAPVDVVCALAGRVACVCSLPLLCQLEVAAAPGVESEANEPGEAGAGLQATPSPTFDSLHSAADEMVDAAYALRAAGVQFVRAAGQATPSCTAALVAALEGLDVVLPGSDADAASISQNAEAATAAAPTSEGASEQVVQVPDAEVADIAARLRERVNSAMQDK
jgi:5-methyltetrahydrofolate--homocysteine methyltransferase